MHSDHYNRSKGFAIASLVCGIVSAVMCCLGAFTLIIGIAAVIFGILALSDIGHQNIKDASMLRGFCIAGIACGVVGVILGLITWVGFSILNCFLQWIF